VFTIELRSAAFYDPRAVASSTSRGSRCSPIRRTGSSASRSTPLRGDHWIYLLRSPTDYSGQHLSRYTLAGDAIADGTERVLLAFEEQRQECCHHAGSLEFGPDGLLFIATGDNTNPAGDSEGFAPIDEREGRAPFDAQKGPANTQSLSGKILRIRPTPEGSYEIPTGNLFTDAAHGRPEIYAMGCRNPWRISVDARTGFLYWGEVGPDAGDDGPRGPMGYDEINQARAAGNFGWPYFIADNQRYPDVDFATGAIGALGDPARPENLSPNNKGARFLPPAQPAWIYYPYGPSARFPELDAPGGRTACAGPVYRFDSALASPTKLPAFYDGCLFAYEWSRNWIKTVRLDDESNPTEILPFLPQTSFLRPVDLDRPRGRALSARVRHDVGHERRLEARPHRLRARQPSAARAGEREEQRRRRPSRRAALRRRESRQGRGRRALVRLAHPARHSRRLARAGCRARVRDAGNFRGRARRDGSRRSADDGDRPRARGQLAAVRVDRRARRTAASSTGGEPIRVHRCTPRTRRRTATASQNPSISSRTLVTKDLSPVPAGRRG
jgi:hypothetical protein